MLPSSMTSGPGCRRPVQPRFGLHGSWRRRPEARGSAQDQNARWGFYHQSPSSGSSDAGELKMGGRKRAAPPKTPDPIAPRGFCHQPPSSGSSDAGEVKMGGRKRAAPPKTPGPIAHRGFHHRSPALGLSDADGSS
ncbi:hypothetical protein C2845_PM11G04650 [Panicum miliaceum]|uniref:Uncharacterized protein n=1 Tax=Panicum miliaceum TaxID=4540 RepID=A0A3L6RVK7_PANMI|nr:hypothetical protein C2845_PM11G04650 [Panicum miliaceum]